MNKSIYTPYTYLLKCIPTGQVYYGVRYGRGCRPSDFWKKYFTSSKFVKILREEYGDDVFDFEIRQTFDNADDAIDWEEKVLRRMNVLHDDRFLNANINKQVRMSREHYKILALKRRGQKRSLETRAKQSRALKGRIFSKEHRRKIGLSSKGRGKGIPKNDEHKRKISEANKGIEHEKSECQFCGEQKGAIKQHESSCYANPENIRYCCCGNIIKRPKWYKKKYCSDECWLKYRELHSMNRKNHSCPICAKLLSAGNYKRHILSCKRKNSKATCAFCGIEYKGTNKYCSRRCLNKSRARPR